MNFTEREQQTTATGQRQHTGRDNVQCVQRQKLDIFNIHVLNVYMYKLKISYAWILPVAWLKEGKQLSSHRGN